MLRWGRAERVLDFETGDRPQWERVMKVVDERVPTGGRVLEERRWDDEEKIWKKMKLVP